MLYSCICSEQYLPYYKELYKSIKKWSPASKQVLYFIGDKVPTEFDQVIDITDWYNNCNPTYNKLERICSLRARSILDAFKYDKNVIFCGAKIKFYNEPKELENALLASNAVAIPHILEPLPEDGKFPSNASVSFTGHLSTDLVGFSDCLEIRKFLEWQDKILKTNCKTTNQTYLDQSWLNFLPFFVDNVTIFKDKRYNVSYWSFDKVSIKDIIAFQFSGLNINYPEKISTHQNRFKAEGEFLKFLEDYARKIKTVIL